MDLLFGPVIISATSHGFTASWEEKDGTFHRSFIPNNWEPWIKQHIPQRQINEKLPCWIPWEMLKGEENWVTTVQHEIRNSDLYIALIHVGHAVD